MNVNTEILFEKKGVMLKILKDVHDFDHIVDNIIEKSDKKTKKKRII